MALLYRYLSAEYALKSIQQNFYRVSPLGSLNDVFDCAPRFIPSKESINRSAQEQEDIHNTLLASLGVLCFSGERDNLLLWAHYGSGYSGIALGFKKDELVPNDKEAWVREVRCNSVDRPTIDESELSELGVASEKGLDYIFDRYSQKGPDWNYEQETRIFVPFRECKPIGTEFFFPLNPRALKEVILGPKCNLCRLNVQMSISQYPLQDVQILKAVPSKESFALEFKEHRM